MGGLLFGYDWVVIGGAKPYYEQFFSIADNPTAQGIAMSSALVGCLVGAVVSGALTDRFGRKRLLLLAAFLFTISAIATALASTFIFFNIARWIGGVGIGLASSLSPLYIAEISPASIRGRLVSVNQLTIVIGVLAAQLVNWAIAQDVPSGVEGASLLDTWCGQVGWRWMFAAETVPAAAFFLLMFVVPESPRWLAKVGRHDQAERILARVGGPAYGAAELVTIRESLASSTGAEVRFRELLDPSLSRVLMIGIVLAVLQQWCGINVIFNYADEIFTAAGYDVRGIMGAIVATGSVNLIFTLVAMATIDHLGRRRLLLFGNLGLAILFLILGTLYYLDSTGPQMIALVLMAIACYAMSLAPVTWVVISEIFPNRIRGAAMSVAVFALWTACTVLTFTFPILNASLGPHGTFWLYGGICASRISVCLSQLARNQGQDIGRDRGGIGLDRQAERRHRRTATKRCNGLASRATPLTPCVIPGSKTIMPRFSYPFALILLATTPLCFAGEPGLPPRNGPQAYLADTIEEFDKTWPNNRRVLIAVHGHSVPTGYFSGSRVMPFDSYPHLLHVAIHQRHPTSVVEVVRTSIGGENSEQGAKRFAADVLALRPDVVTIDYALNDRPIGLQRAHAAWSTMIEAAKQNDVKLILLTPTPDLNADINDPADPLALHAEQIRRLAAEHHVALVDSYAAFQRIVLDGGDLSKLMSQPNHPNRKGHELVTKELTKWFLTDTERQSRRQGK